VPQARGPVLHDAEVIEEPMATADLLEAWREGDAGGRTR
jgi:hypothetical protein